MPRHSITVPQGDIPAILSRLTERDRLLITVLGEHQVLTTPQVAAMFFDSLNRAQERLYALHKLRILERFRTRLRYGSEPWHYTLAHLGARIHAAATIARPPTPAAVTDRLLRIAASPKLNHLLGVNDFFARLHRAARRADNATISDWWPEQRCAEACGGMIRPDGHATYIAGDQAISFWYEHDTGTEGAPRLQAKLNAYAQLLHPHTRLPVLIETSSSAREFALQETLNASHGLIVATSHQALTDDPAGSAWLPLRGLARMKLPMVIEGR